MEARVLTQVNVLVLILFARIQHVFALMSIIFTGMELTVVNFYNINNDIYFKLGLTHYHTKLEG